MIPVNEPLIGEREIQYVMDCLKTGWISSAGKYIEEFEQKWAAYCGMKYGVAVNNGTTALQVAVRGLGLEPRPFFLGMHEQPVLLERGLFRGERYPIAERIAQQGLYLPSGLALTESQLDQICEAVRKVLA